MADVNLISLVPTPAEPAKKTNRERSEINQDWLDEISFTAKQDYSTDNKAAQDDDSYAKNLQGISRSSLETAAMRNPHFDTPNPAFGLSGNRTGLRRRQTSLRPPPLRPGKPRETTLVRSPKNESRMANGKPTHNSTIEAPTSPFASFAIHFSDFAKFASRNPSFNIVPPRWANPPGVRILKATRVRHHVPFRARSHDA